MVLKVISTIWYFSNVSFLIGAAVQTNERTNGFTFPSNFFFPRSFSQFFCVLFFNFRAARSPIMYWHPVTFTCIFAAQLFRLDRIWSAALKTFGAGCSRLTRAIDLNTVRKARHFKCPFVLTPFLTFEFKISFSRMTNRARKGIFKGCCLTLGTLDKGKCKDQPSAQTNRLLHILFWSKSVWRTISKSCSFRDTIFSGKEIFVRQVSFLSHKLSVSLDLRSSREMLPLFSKFFCLGKF